MIMIYEKDGQGCNVIAFVRRLSVRSGDELKDANDLTFFCGVVGVLTF